MEKLIRDLFGKTALTMMVLRLIPSDLIILCLILLAIYWFRRSEKLKAFLASYERVIQVLALVAVLAGLGMNFTRLLLSTSGIPTVVEALQLTNGRPECLRVFGSGMDYSKFLAEWNDAGALMRAKHECGIVSKEVSLGAKSMKSRLLDSLEDGYLFRSRGFRLLEGPNKLSTPELDVTVVYGAIEIRSKMPIDRVEAITCYPRPKFLHVYGAVHKDGKWVPVEEPAGWVLRDVRLVRVMQENQYSCLGLKLSYGASRKALLVTTGVIELVDLNE